LGGKRCLYRFLQTLGPLSRLWAVGGNEFAWFALVAARIAIHSRNFATFCQRSHCTRH
jgi:hypothetical protein